MKPCKVCGEHDCAPMCDCFGIYSIPNVITLLQRIRELEQTVAGLQTELRELKEKTC